MSRGERQAHSAMHGSAPRTERVASQRLSLTLVLSVIRVLRIQHEVRRPGGCAERPRGDAASMEWSRGCSLVLRCALRRCRGCAGQVAVGC
jgi:hypothetical protein